MDVQFFVGVAVGAIVALVALALAQSAGRTLPWAAEDAAKQTARTRREDIEKEKEAAHEVVETITPQELDLIVSGRATFSDIVRGRKDPASPYFRPELPPKPAA